MIMKSSIEAVENTKAGLAQLFFHCECGKSCILLQCATSQPGFEIGFPAGCSAFITCNNCKKSWNIYKISRKSAEKTPPQPKEINYN